MKILVNIDQKAALLAGIDAPNSTAEIEINPAQMSQEHREFLAQFLSDGYRADRAINKFANTFYLKLSNATQDDLISALIDVKAEMDARVAERLESIKEATASVEEKISNVDYCAGGYCVNDEISLLKIDYLYLCGSDKDYAELKELIESYFDVKAKIEVENEKRKEAHQPILLKKHAEKMTAINTAINKVKNEYDALYARLPEFVRRRNDAGFANDDEIETEIKKLICSDVGLDYIDLAYDTYKPTHATDAEFAQFEKLTVPEAWRKELRRVNEFESSDDDRNIIELSTTFAGLNVETYIELE
jgi:hypothetical protein